MLLSVLLLITGFVFLIKGADFFVEGASSLAKRFAISEIVIGLTVVAFGTSAPELVVNVFAALSDQSAISFGNVIGSNISNILLILGVAGIIYPLSTQKNTVWREIPFALLSAFALIIIVNDNFFAGAADILNRGDSLILLLFFIIFLVYTFAISKIEMQHAPEVRERSLLKISLFIVIGLAGLIAGGSLVVNNAAKIARVLGLSEKLIGLTIIAIGTSLPELFTSAVAATKRKTDIAVGNIIGSNIFNILFILSVTGLVRPLPYDAALNIDMYILLIASFLLFITMFTGKRRSLDRWEAILFLMLYIGYSIFLILRG